MKTKDDFIIISQRPNGWIVDLTDPETDETTEYVFVTPNDIGSFIKNVLSKQRI